MSVPIRKSRVKLLAIGSEKSFLEKIKNIFSIQSRTFQPNTRFALFSAGNWNQAMETFQKEHPDIIIIAENFTDGIKLCRIIRSSEDCRHTGIMFFQTQNAGATPTTYLEAGADDFIPSTKDSREILARSLAVVRLKTMTDELRQANHRLEILSFTDDLTGLYNMRYLQIDLAKAARNCALNRGGFGVVMMDLDHFKDINDSTNHLVGSFIISEIGKLLRLTSIFGENACVARYGGDEFIAIAPADSSQYLEEKGETLRQLIREAVFHREGFEIKVTTSIGLCFAQNGFAGDPNDTVKAADYMLYKSKEEGRDRVSSVTLRDSIDFDHICRTHLVNRNTGGKNNRIARFNYIKVLK